MSNIIKVHLVSYPRAGYSGGYSEPSYMTTLINLNNVSRIKRNNDSSLKGTNTLVYFVDHDKACYCHETLDEFEKLIKTT